MFEKSFISVAALAAVVMAGGLTVSTASAQIPAVNSFTFNSYENYGNSNSLINSTLTLNGGPAFPQTYNQFSPVSLNTSPIVVREVYPLLTPGFANTHMLWFSNDGGASPATIDGTVSFGMRVRARIQTNHPTGPGAPINSETGFWFQNPRTNHGGNNYTDKGGVWLITNGTSFVGGAGMDYVLLGEGSDSVNFYAPPLYTAGGWAQMSFTYFAPGAISPGSPAAWEASVLDESSGRLRSTGRRGFTPIPGSSENGFNPGTKFGIRFQSQVYASVSTDTTITIEGFQLQSLAAAAQITIPTATVGNPGNAPDPTTGYGSVAYAYNIGRTEVTNAQYSAFLNAKAASDPFNLYNTNMAETFGGITRSGSPGSYTYSTVSGRANNPVNYVSFWDACRFANWLHNGQGSGDTENGAYTLTPNGIANNTITRNTGAVWAVTSENEWYKAAYHQPASEGGDADNYWLFPTSSNSEPTTEEATFGDAIGNTTPVGSYAANFYGTFDMGGNVWEWNETIPFSSMRAVRGGSWGSYVDRQSADSRNLLNVPSIESFVIGFRVSQVAGCDPPTISTPLGSTVCPGQPIALAATAAGATSYQWLKDLVEIPGATQANLEISSAAAIDAGSYRVRATFPCGTRTSDPLEVRVANCQPASYFFDSEAQYSGIQGWEGWEYGFYDGDAGVAFTPADFEPLPIFAPLPPPFGDNVTPIWHRHPLNYWTQIGSSLVHPNGVAAGRIPEVNWAVRRWTCPPGFSARPIRVRIDVSDTQETCGDGVTVAFNKFSLPILNQTVPPTESLTTILADCLTPGTVYTLAIGPGNSGNEQCDTFNSRLRIGTPFIDEPTSALRCRNQPVTFGLRVPSNIPVQYQWRHDGEPIDPASNPSAATAFLHIPHATAQTTGEYDCVVTFPCGTATCDPVELSICPADFNCDGFPDGFDYDDFVAAFEAGEGLAADFNNDGFVDGFDYDDFVTAFETGC